MSFLDRIRTCNRYAPENFRPLLVGTRTAGWIKREFARQLSRWPRVFVVEEAAVRLHAALDTPALRTEAVDRVVETLHAEGLIRHRHPEFYPVTADGRRDRPLMLINRAAAPWFGIRAFGQHLNGYVSTGDGLMMWISRRSASKWNFPNKLDNLVAGGLPHDLSPAENLRKECFEEAGIAPELADRARPVGTVSYCVETRVGLKPDVMYCYDLELPADFRPVSQDGEVEEFRLLPVEEVAEIVRDSESFKMNCDLVVIDFLVRHGLIGPEHEDYLELVTGLRRSPAPL